MPTMTLGPEIESTPELNAMIDDGAVVAFGVSGGKDSSTMVLAVNEWLDGRGHPKSKRLCVHADLGVIEWPQTDDMVRKLATFAELPLTIVRRNAGDMLDRWEQRWANNVTRYQNLACVTLITPWSTPAMRFCTSELKVAPITSALKKMFPGEVIINATGIRRQESSNRALASVVKETPKLTVKTKGTRGYTWNPILGFTLDQVHECHKRWGFALHPAYTEFGSSRLSCSLCILATKNDHLAALKEPRNHPAFRRISKLELESTFSFQSKRWVVEYSPDLVDEFTSMLIPVVQAKADQRRALEARIPKELLFVKGWPTSVPTVEQAGILAEVRAEVSDIMGFSSLYLTTQDLRERYATMVKEKEAKDAVIAAKA